MAKGEKGGDKDKDKDKTPELAKGGTGEKEVRIYSLATTVNECIIFLEELSGSRLLPIWIGITEGQAIAIRFSGIVLPRPLTHDLLLAGIQELGFEVKKIVVSDIKENTFYAKDGPARQPPVRCDRDRGPRRLPDHGARERLRALPDLAQAHFRR